MEECKITFYDISQCGYYKKGTEDAEFCNIQDALNELKTWAFQEDMTLGQTCTFSLDDYNEDISKTYCFNLVSDNYDNYLLITWNEVHSVEGQVASVSSSGTVGQAEVNLTEIPQNSIPGYATYFWFIPSQNIFACIQFHNQLNGRKNLEKYLRDFLAKCARYAVIRETSGGEEFEVLGYRQNDNEQHRYLYPRFKSLLHKKNAEIDYLRSNRDRIRKLIRKDILSLQVQQDVEFWQKALTKIGISSQDTTHAEDVRYKLAVNYQPSESELEDIINSWDQESSHDRWDDVGFLLEGETRTRWLSHSLNRSTIELDVRRDNDEIVNAESLLAALTQRQDTLLP